MITRRRATIVLWTILAAATAGCGDDATADGDAATADADGGVDGSSDAGADADAASDAPIPFGCEIQTVVRYDPFESTELLRWPDDVHTVDDPDSPTGLRVSLDPATTPWLDELPDLLQPVAEDMGVLSGFGANAGALFRFETPIADLPATEAASVESSSILWFDLSTDPPARVPFESAVSDEGRDVVLSPLRPLQLGARHAIFVMRSLRDADGACGWPSDTTTRLLDGGADGPREERLADRWDAAIDATGVSANDIAGISVFTVHDDLGPVLDAAEVIRGGDTAGRVGDASCDEGSPRRCELVVRALDFRDDRYIETATSTAEWELPVSVWIPEGEGPFPFLVFGHGINAARGSAGSVARFVAEQGFAVVAVDAMHHGEHPTQRGAHTLDATEFLGIDLGSLQVDPLSLRGNFDQTNLDRLQVVEALRAEPDVDGDGEPDLDLDRFGYWGISLGGMLGAGFAALSPDAGAVILSVAGGRLLQFATDTAQVAPLMPLIATVVGSEELLQRLLPLAQCIVDPADPATWGPLVLDGDAPPNLLFPVALHDNTVPPSTGRALARGIGLPQIGEHFYDVEVIGSTAAPLTGNVADGAATAAYMQFDRVSRGSGVEAATHDNVPLSPEGREQARVFLQTWLDSGVSEIIDPYWVLETPTLDEEPAEK